MADERAERPGRIADVHQYESADDRIEALVRVEGLHVGDGKPAPMQALRPLRAGTPA
jgi:hypothetical protein